jgi:hypothetical protein
MGIDAELRFTRRFVGVDSLLDNRRAITLIVKTTNERQYLCFYLDASLNFNRKNNKVRQRI